MKIIQIALDSESKYAYSVMFVLSDSGEIFYKPLMYSSSNPELMDWGNWERLDLPFPPGAMPKS